MKVIELTIDDLEDFGGLDAISIVERPAHESNFLAFKNDNPDVPIYEMLDDAGMTQLAFEMTKLGEPMGTLEKEGYVIVKMEDAIPEQEIMEQFAKPSSNPNPSNESEFLPRIRYKYTGIVRDNTRDFCKIMLNSQRVFTEEDIAQLSSLNPIGPSDYDVLRWRGSYNCLHKWTKMTYAPKEQAGDIINSINSKRGLISEEEGALFDTRNRKTATAEAEGRSKGVNIGPRLGGWFNKEDFGIIEIVDEMPIFEKKEEAEYIAEMIGCKGSHEHQLDGGVVGYMPCEKHEFQSYNDYPEAASENACRVLRWIDEHGRDEVSGMERTGLARANSLCKKENITESTIARMASFERHRKNSKINPEFKGTPWKDKGYVAWLAWGGDEGIAWAQKKLQQIADDMSEEEMLYENPCQSGYVAYGTKMKNGKKVPNCVKQSKEEFGCGCGKDNTKNNNVKFDFSTDDEKMEITGAALIPNKMIIRRTPPTINNPRGEFYYVFFSEETIKKLAEKFMKEKRLDNTNIEHSEFEADSYVKESWIVEDEIFDKSSALGLEYPKGTWVITMKVNNKSVWKNIKEGKLNGYSVEGWFNENLLFN